MEKVIEVRDLKRIYDSQVGFIRKKTKKVEALKGITFHVNKGEIFGLLGPNGAGKTTTIKILTTLLAQSDGEAYVLGYKPFGEENMIRNRINFIFGGERSLYWRLSGKDNLHYFCDLYKIPKKEQENIVNELLNLVSLKGRENEKVETYSKGMKQRLQIARSLLNDPDILFLDEPTIGLDPVGAKDLRIIIKNLSNKGKTIVLTTHYMQEAEELCDRIGIIKDGKLVALDNIEGLKERVDKTSKIIFKMRNEEKTDLNQVIQDLEEVSKMYVDKKEDYSVITVITNKPETTLSKVLEIRGIKNILSFDIKKSTLEDVYIQLVGEKNAN